MRRKPNVKSAVRKAARKSLKLLEQLLFSFNVVRPRRTTQTRRVPVKPALAPELVGIWQRLQEIYFPDRTDLLNYSVHWSGRRQKRVLASCNIRKRTVIVAREMRHESVSHWCEPLLFHEMCHAVLGCSIRQRGRKTPWHGREFKDLERRHPGSVELNTWIRSGGWAKAVRSARSRSRFEIKPGQPYSARALQTAGAFRASRPE